MLQIANAKREPPKSGMAIAPDPLEDIEAGLGIELPERFHELAEKPTKRPKKQRGRPSEGYWPMHHRR